MKRVNTENISSWIESLSVGEEILLSGSLYTARDAVHKRLALMIEKGQKLPVELEGAVIYYAGPTAAREGRVIGSCGPTTSSRMDVYTPDLLDRGLKCMIGKGERSNEVVSAIIRNKAAYLCAVGGAGALISESVKSCETVAFDELGCESLKKLTVEDLPLIVAINSKGDNIFERNG